MDNLSGDRSAHVNEPPIDEEFSSQFQEPITPSNTNNSIAHEDTPHKSTAAKIKDTLTKPFHKEKDTPPDLQDAIDKMEARKEATARKMEADGKDASVLSGKRVDIMKGPA